jgi:hypothetical protein
MDYQEKARALKKAGFVDYDLRRNLNQGQKSQITKLWDKHSAIFTHPGNFVSRTVEKHAARKMKENGYAVAGRKVFITKEGYADIHVKTKKKKGGKGRDVLITRVVGNKTQKTRVYTETELLAALSKAEPEKLPKGHAITVRIGASAPFKIRYSSKAQLQQYLRDDFRPKDPGEDKENLISQMNIVIIKGAPPATKGKYDKAGKRKKNRRKVS